MNKRYEIKKLAEFKKIVSDVFDWYEDNCNGEALVLALQGDLGAGKTAFTQELGKFLNIEETINSPTFTIVKKYPTKGGLFDEMVHIDAYRIEDGSEVKPLKIEEMLLKSNTVLCIEWPELIESIIPPSAVRIKIKITKNNTREVSVSQNSVK
ncbi:MAG: tRNA (adenosine(37)-N6)-threonylcarbamoyltransferase complex ATPase subunit type 1 TsaE [Candidatus Pacebacteria bacterium]|nr:tRNA (adenosine(37)-N6)-threonylcarbamoyltransferase complex ATPase subunit type 1 TsaE [Candidatus Paceibacterota bacterium]